ncbi:MAG: universal stress protein [Acidobacteriota bacterium]
MRIRKICMPTDFSETAETAFGHALALAERFGASLDVLHVSDLHTVVPYDEIHHEPSFDDVLERLEETSGSEMQRLLQKAESGDVMIREHQRRGISVAPTIIEFATDHDIDLLVLGAHGRRGLRRLLLGSVAEEVVQTAPCSVLTLRAGEATATPQPWRRILVPFDFSSGARHALRAAKELAARDHAMLEVVHVIDTPIYPAVYGLFGEPLPTPDFPRLVTGVEEHLATAVDAVGGPDVTVAVKAVAGTPADGVLSRADDTDPDLIVLATRGLTGVEHLLLGSVAEKIVRRSACPVWTVKGADEADEANA